MGLVSAPAVYPDREKHLEWVKTNGPAPGCTCTDCEPMHQRRRVLREAWLFGFGASLNGWSEDGAVFAVGHGSHVPVQATQDAARAGFRDAAGIRSDAELRAIAYAEAER